MNSYDYRDAVRNPPEKDGFYLIHGFSSVGEGYAVAEFNRGKWESDFLAVTDWAEIPRYQDRLKWRQAYKFPPAESGPVECVNLFSCCVERCWFDAKRCRYFLSEHGIPNHGVAYWRPIKKQEGGEA